jgi:hypothetical protein
MICISILVTRPQDMNEEKSISLTRDYDSVVRFTKCQNNLTINESIYDCTSDAN